MVKYVKERVKKMEFKGITRTVDKMGRVVIPKELRDQLNIKDNVDKFEITVEGEKVILRKYQPTCIFCNEISDGVKYNGYNVCQKCIEKLNIMLEEKAENIVSE